MLRRWITKDAETRTRLTEFDIKEVSIVPKAANAETFIIIKHDDDGVEIEDVDLEKEGWDEDQHPRDDSGRFGSGGGGDGGNRGGGERGEGKRTASSAFGEHSKKIDAEVKRIEGGLKQLDNEFEGKEGHSGKNWGYVGTVAAAHAALASLAAEIRGDDDKVDALYENPPTSNSKVAREAYQFHRAGLDRAISDIRSGMNDFAKDQAKNPKDWGYAGSAEHFVEELTDAVEHISGEEKGTTKYKGGDTNRRQHSSTHKNEDNPVVKALDGLLQFALSTGGLDVEYRQKASRAVKLLTVTTKACEALEGDNRRLTADLAEANRQIRTLKSYVPDSAAHSPDDGGFGDDDKRSTRVQKDVDWPRDLNEEPDEDEK